MASPNRLKGEEVLSHDSWRGDWYKMGLGECWIDTGHLDIRITVEEGYVHVRVYPNSLSDLLDESAAIKQGDKWVGLFGPNEDPIITPE